MNDIINEQSRCIAHEIRNHLSICELYAQIIKKNLEKQGVKNQSIDNALSCINKSIKIMGNSLLDLKSLNNFSPKICNLEKLLKEGVSLAEIYAADKNINISLDIKGNAGIYIDENKFLACIVNIIKNNIEAIEKNGEINIISYVNDKFAYVRFINNGPAISKELQTKIFKEGFTTKSTGTGLGLYICANNLKSQNADLRLVSSTEKCTEFEITLPVVEI